MVLTLKRKMSLKHFRNGCTHRTLQKDKKNKSRIEIHNHLLSAIFFTAVPHFFSTEFLAELYTAICTYLPCLSLAFNLGGKKYLKSARRDKNERGSTEKTPRREHIQKWWKFAAIPNKGILTQQKSQSLWQNRTWKWKKKWKFFLTALRLWNHSL